MKRFSLVIVLFFVLAIAVVVDRQNNPRSDKMLERVVVAQAFEVFLYAPLYIAEDHGFFTAEGLDVEIVTAGGDDKAFAAVLSGDALLAVGDPTFTAISAERGKPGVVVAGLLRGVPFMGVTNDQNLTINNAKDLSGLKIATFPSPSTAYTVQHQYLAENNVNAEIVETSFGTLLAALDNGSVDVALELEPNVSLAKKNGKRVVYSLATEYPDFAITGVTTVPKNLETNKETIEAFNRALQSSLMFIKEHPEEAAMYMHARFPEVEESVARDAITNMSQQGVFPEDTKVSVKGWEEAIDVRRSVGDLTIEASYSEFVK